MRTSSVQHSNPITHHLHQCDEAHSSGSSPAACGGFPLHSLCLCARKLFLRPKLTESEFRTSIKQQSDQMEEAKNRDAATGNIRAKSEQSWQELTGEHETKHRKYYLCKFLNLCSNWSCQCGRECNMPSMKSTGLCCLSTHSALCQLGVCIWGQQSSFAWFTVRVESRFYLIVFQFSLSLKHDSLDPVFLKPSRNL